jgi:glycosyltransferase involved in cell wall biosynthesis
MLSFTSLEVSSNTYSAPRRILIAAPFPPGRNSFHGGSQVIGCLIDELAGIHSVAVAYLRASDESPMEAALAGRCAAVEEVPRPKSKVRYLRLMGAWARGDPMWVEDWRVPAFRVRLRQLVERWRPHVMQFEFHTMAQYVDQAKGCCTILVEHEPGAAAARDRWQFSGGWRRPILARDLRAWEAFERASLEKFHAVVCFTEKDRRELSALAPAAHIVVIPPCGPALTGSEVCGRVQANTILFAGNFIHPPNVDAAIRLANDIFPRVRARHPEAVLQLVGDAPPASVRRLAGPGVVVTARVPSMAAFLDAAAMVVAPLRMGGGIRIKVMDALVFGKPLVATPLAAEGMDLVDGQDLLLAETDEEFADCISSLLSDASLRQSLSANARAWALRFGKPGRVAEAFDRLYRSADCIAAGSEKEEHKT